MSNIKKKKEKKPDVSFLYKTQFGPLRTISAETTRFLPPRTVSSVGQQLKLKAGMREICFDIGRPAMSHHIHRERGGARDVVVGGGGGGRQRQADKQANKQAEKKRR